MSSASFNFATSKPGKNLRGWLVCISAGLFFFYEFFQLNLFDVINQQIRLEFKVDATQLSWLSSTFLWADIIFLLPAGIILDLFSTRLVILITMLLCVMATFYFGFTHSFLLACLLHFIVGIGNAFCFLACAILVTRWFVPKRQALVFGSLITMAFIGGMLAHTPFAYVANLYGWRLAILLDGLIGVLLWVWMYLIVADKPAEENQGQTVKLKDAQPRKKNNFWLVLVTAQNWLAGWYTCLLNLPLMALGALWGASLLEIGHNISQLTASNIVSLIFIGCAIGSPIAGYLADHLQKRKPIMVLGAIGTFVAVLPLIFTYQLSQLTLSILFFAIGLFSSTQVISYPLIAEANIPENTGLATAVASIIIMGGAALGQLLFGWLMQVHAIGLNVYTKHDYAYAASMFPSVTFLAALLVFFMRESNNYASKFKK